MGTSTVNTAVISVGKNSRSVRTVIPIWVVEQLGLQAGDTINWRIEKSKTGFKAAIIKIEG